MVIGSANVELDLADPSSRVSAPGIFAPVLDLKIGSF